MAAFNFGPWTKAQKDELQNRLGSKVMASLTAATSKKKNRPNQEMLAFYNFVREQDKTSMLKAANISTALEVAAELCDLLDLHLPSERTRNHITKCVLFIRGELLDTGADSVYTHALRFKDKLDKYKTARYVADPIVSYTTPDALPSDIYKKLYETSPPANFTGQGEISIVTVPKAMRSNCNALKGSQASRAAPRLTNDPAMNSFMRCVSQLMDRAPDDDLPPWLTLTGPGRKRADATSRRPSSWTAPQESEKQDMQLAITDRQDKKQADDQGDDGARAATDQTDAAAAPGTTGTAAPATATGAAPKPTIKRPAAANAGNTKKRPAAAGHTVQKRPAVRMGCTKCRGRGPCIQCKHSDFGGRRLTPAEYDAEYL